MSGSHGGEAVTCPAPETSATTETTATTATTAARRRINAVDWTKAARRRINAVDWPETADPQTGRAVALVTIEAVPPGWHYLGWLTTRVLSADVWDMHLLHGEDAWLYMYTDWEAGRTTPGLVKCTPSLGAMYDFTKDKHYPEAYLAVGRIVAEALPPEHAGVGLLLRLGGIVDLPDECYDPAFGVPTS